ncbi:hypothetical protein JMJ35_002713 [Cladonia borealis]|uniref:Vacuolar membrane protein n=1 Tax=Cladonia borealis TaxID=184061 RepID=A0AA39R7Z0_9LECA|nr:hypothetical protein JMJ35_002713 [Cladonia borealis]
MSPEDVVFPDHAAPTLPAEVAAMILTPTISFIATATYSQSLAFPTMTPAYSVNSTISAESRPGAENGECKLLGPFALIVQAALGALALLSLVYKRWRERPQRPLKIWAFDASKQVVGSALLHVANLLMSMLSSGQLTVKADDYQANPCSFYLLNLAIDTTIGIPILVILLRLLTHAFLLTPLGNPPESIESGNYGQPPKTKWWIKQSFIYFLGLLGMKLCVFFIFQICPWIIRVGDWALRWTEGNETVQVFFVMLFFPVVMNALQYYIIDSFIKDQKPSDHEPIPSEDGDSDDIDDDGRARRPDSVGSDGRGDSPEVSETSKDGSEIKVSSPDLKMDPRKLDEYDPAVDGEGSGSNEEPDSPLPEARESRAKPADSPAKAA